MRSGVHVATLTSVSVSKFPLFHDVADRFTGRDRPDPDRCPVCDAEHTTCIPDGYMPPGIPRTLPTVPIGAPLDLPADEYEWADQGSDLVRVKRDLYVTVTHQGATTRTGRSLLFPRGMLVTRTRAAEARALYAEDQALHPGEVK